MSLRRVRVWRMCAALLISVMALGLGGIATAQSQANTGQVLGTSFDSSGAVIPQVKVLLQGKDTGLSRDEVTGSEGQYRFILVPVGNYSVTFTKDGFKTYKVDVEVTVGSAITVNASLQVGEITQTVEVQETALIESTATASDALIGVRAIEELPINGRRFQDFVTLTPTVQIEPQRNGISFAGQRGINGNVTIDGADYNEPFFGGIRGGERANNAFTIPQEAISQFQVVPTGYSVEFGRSTGGIVNATTKSGTNDWHGSAFFFARNGVLAKKDAFGRDAISALYQEGGAFGGHIVRDKAFFFAAIENQKNDNPRVVVFHLLDNFTPAPPQQEAFNFYSTQQGPFTQTNDALTGLGRLDFLLSQKHRASASYHYSKNTGTNAVSTGDAISPETNRAQSNNGTEGDRTNNIVGQWTAVWSTHLVQETRAQYSLENRPRLSNSTLTGLSGPIGITGARDFLPTTLNDWRTQVSSNLSWSSGAHVVKFGGEYNFIHANQQFFFNQFGVFSVNVAGCPTNPRPPNCNDSVERVKNTLNLLSKGIQGQPNRLDPTGRRDSFGRPLNPTVTYRVNIGNGLVDADTKQIALFIQDTWRINRNLTVTPGFRWEGYVNPQPDVSNTDLYNMVKKGSFPIGRSVDPAVIPNNYRQFMPRLGIAWDPRGDAKTVIRANAGIFYATTPLLILAAPLNNFRALPGDLSVQLPLSEATLPMGAPCKSTPTVYCQLKLIGIDLNTVSLDSLPKITPAQITQLATVLGLSSPNPSLSSSPITMANDYESPRSWQWNLGVEREIRPRWAVGVDFNYVNTVHLERNRNLNLPAPVIAAADRSLRPCFGIGGNAACSQFRPIRALGDITIRATDARSLYRGVTFRSNYRHRRIQMQAFYTLSYNFSDDDGERLATGFDHDNEFNLQSEYNYSRLDTRHLFQYNTIVDVPWGFTLSSLGRFRSGRPMEALAGLDLNGDNTSFPDRAFIVPGVSFKRNAFRDRPVYNVDMRVAWDAFRALRAMKVNPREGMKLAITADFFNLFNLDNVVYIGGTPSPFNPIDVYGAGVDRTGAVLPPNPSFRLLKDQQFCNSNRSCYNTNATPGAPLTVQLGLRFEF